MAQQPLTKSATIMAGVGVFCLLAPLGIWGYNKAQGMIHYCYNKTLMEKGIKEECARGYQTYFHSISWFLFGIAVLLVGFTLMSTTIGFKNVLSRDLNSYKFFLVSILAIIIASTIGYLSLANLSDLSQLDDNDCECQQIYGEMKITPETAPGSKTLGLYASMPAGLVIVMFTFGTLALLLSAKEPTPKGTFGDLGQYGL